MAEPVDLGRRRHAGGQLLRLDVGCAETWLDLGVANYSDRGAAPLGQMRSPPTGVCIYYCVRGLE